MTTRAQVYEGQVVGVYNKTGDLKINVCKAKALTNMRASQSEKKVRLARARRGVGWGGAQAACVCVCVCVCVCGVRGDSPRLARRQRAPGRCHARATRARATHVRHAPPLAHRHTPPHTHPHTHTPHTRTPPPTHTHRSRWTRRA
jgi:hypothetical protein